MACFSGYTDGNYVYTDCCGITYSGTSIGEIVCLDTSLPYSNVTATTTPCSVVCDEGPLEYFFSVTGVCDNAGNGAIEITPQLGQKPYTLDNTIPGSLSGETGLGPFTYTGLTGGTYVFRLNDSSGGVNDDIFINVIVPDCICANIDDVSGTTCGSADGSLQVNVTPTTNPYTYDLYLNGGPIASDTGNTTTYQFNNLASGLYYAIVTDFAGATAKTETVVVDESTQLDFGFQKVDESFCLQGQASATVTGQTGQSPYTYLWSNGQTGSTATGLTSNVYSVTVTDNLGCQRTKQVTIGNVPQLGLVNVVSTNASCFSCNGTATVRVSGGTAPYTFVADNGQQGTTNQTTYLVQNLCGGSHSIIVTDAAGCQINVVANVSSTAGFTVVSVNTTNAQCNLSGSIQINLTSNQQQIYTYTITDSNGSTQSITTSNTSQVFNNLTSGTYDVTVTSSGGCIYEVEKTITNQNNFEFIISSTNSTCGGTNGELDVFISSNGTPINYPLTLNVRDLGTNQIVYQNPILTSNSDNISNLPSGTYEVIITDSQGCTYRKTTAIGASEPINFTVFKTDCILGDDGTATLSIYQGEPPFTIVWSNGQTGMSVTDLTGGTYSVSVTDSNGCSLEKNFTINCQSRNVECYEINAICEKGFTTTIGQKRDLLSMVWDAYLDISAPYENCTLVQSIFSVTYGFTGTTGTISGATLSYYTGTSLNDIPSDQDWVDAINQVLSGVTEITSVEFNLETNELIIKLDCDEKGNFILKSGVELILSCDQPSPSPTPTQTVTPTPSVTSTPNATPNPTTTPTPSPTPSCTGVTWMTWSTNIDASATFDSGNVTLSTTMDPSGNIPFYTSVYQYNRLDCPDKNPNTVAQGISKLGYYTYTFSQPVTNPYLAIYSLGSDGLLPITASLSADTAFTVYCSGTSNPSYEITYDLVNQTVTGTEGYGIIKFNGTVSQITLYYTVGEAYTQLVWGLPCDTTVSNTTPTPTPTQTPTPTNTISTLTVNTNAINCASGAISIVKNGTTTIHSSTHISGNGGVNTTDNYTVNIGDTLEIFGEARTPTGGCASIAYYTDLSVDVSGETNPVIDITSFDSDSYSFTVNSSSVIIDIDFLVS